MPKLASLQPVKGKKEKSLVPPEKEIVVKVDDKTNQRKDKVFPRPVPQGETYDSITR